jgi:type III secretion protein V
MCAAHKLFYMSMKPDPLRAAAPMTWLQRLTARSDVFLAIFLSLTVALIVLPVPPFLLDTLIAFSIASSVGLLMLSMYVASPLALSTFPALLLFTTLFRLALSIGSTKQILLHAHAGDIIETFGRLVIGGSIVVGLVVFAVIAIVQFLVIAKGAERVAEVGARFTLDAMPGKQMSIDADLRAGVIDKDEARRRRAMLSQESQLHGAMDGAMKFVKNDAIATILIAAINMLAGITIGVALKDMSMAEAGARYTVLTVGDGMVAQIPSLFVSIAAGILITRVSGREQADNLGTQITEQIVAQPAALIATGALLLAMAVVPGFPKLQFIVLALLIGGVGYVLAKERRATRTFEDAQLSSAQRDGISVSARLPLLDSGETLIAQPLVLRLSPNLRDGANTERLDASLAAQRQSLHRELGVPFPGLRLRFDATLPTSGYAVDVQEVMCVSGTCPSLEPQAREEWLVQQVIVAVRRRADAFVGMQEVQSLIRRVDSQLPDLVSELQRMVPLQRVTDVLRRLVQEGVSLRYLREIFESLVTWSAKEKDIVQLTEYIRVDMGRLISHRYINEAGKLSAWVLEPDTEQVVRQAIQQGPTGSFLALAPEVAKQVQDGVHAAVTSLGDTNPNVLVTSMDVRRYVKRLLTAPLPDLVVLSFQELPPDCEIASLGRAGMSTLRQAA